MIPGNAHACEAHIKENLCKEKPYCDNLGGKHPSKDVCSKTCCEDEMGEGHDCYGECGPKTCRSVSQSYSTMSPLTGIPQVLFDTATKKHYDLYKQPNYSSGFLSVWLLPKIG